MNIAALQPPTTQGINIPDLVEQLRAANPGQRFLYAPCFLKGAPRDNRSHGPLYWFFTNRKLTKATAIPAGFVLDEEHQVLRLAGGALWDEVYIHLMMDSTPSAWKSIQRFVRQLICKIPGVKNFVRVRPP